MKLYPLCFPYDIPAHYSDTFPVDIRLVVYPMSISFTGGPNGAVRLHRIRLEFRSN